MTEDSLAGPLQQLSIKDAEDKEVQATVVIHSGPGIDPACLKTETLQDYELNAGWTKLKLTFTDGSSFVVR